MFASGGIVGEARQQLIVQFLVPRLWFVPRGTIGLAATVHWGKGSGPGRGDPAGWSAIKGMAILAVNFGTTGLPLDGFGSQKIS